MGVSVYLQSRFCATFSQKLAKYCRLTLFTKKIFAFKEKMKNKATFLSGNKLDTKVNEDFMITIDFKCISKWTFRPKNRAKSVQIVNFHTFHFKVKVLELSDLLKSEPILVIHSICIYFFHTYVLS